MTRARMLPSSSKQVSRQPAPPPTANERRQMPRLATPIDPGRGRASAAALPRSSPLMCDAASLVQGVSARVVMDVLGHSRIGLTMNTYSHVIPDLRREAAARIQQVLESERQR